MAQMLGVEGLSKLHIAFKVKPAITGARIQYLIEPEKNYLDGQKAEDSKLRKFTIGKKDPEKPNKTVLLVGETGTGKSVLINAMLNHVMGTTYESNEWFKIIDEEGKQTFSRTEKITVYELFAFHSEEFPYSLTIVDTPGFGDTRGLKRDKQLPRVLQKLFTNEVKEVDAVGLVLKESTNRLDDRQGYIFNSIVSLFGKDLENNIVALITHASGQPIKTPLEALEGAGIKIARNERNKPICFRFQNTQTEVSEGEEFEEAIKYAWSTSNKGMKAFFDYLKKVESQKLQQTAAVLTKQIELEARADSFSEKVKMLEAKQRQINQTKKALMQLQSDKVQGIKQIEEPYKELEKSIAWWFNKTTRCTVCQENCHSECYCWYRFQCAVMKDGKCTLCERKCEESKHVRDKEYYVLKTRKVAVEDVAKKYEKQLKKEGLKRELEKREEELARTKQEEIDEIYLCVVELDAIALKGNSIYTYKHLDFLIKNLKEVGVERNNEKIHKLTEIKTCIEKEQSQGIRYMFASLGTQALDLGTQALDLGTQALHLGTQALGYMWDKGKKVAAAAAANTELGI